MMLPASAAARNFSPNPLPNPFLGYGGVPTGLGAVSPELAHQLALEIAAGAGPDTAAWRAYYGPGGVYSQAPSVIRAAEEAAAHREPLGDQPAPMLYAAKVCGAAEMMSTDCVSYNAQVQQANMALQENARRAWNLRVCEDNAAVNPGTATDQPCTQFQTRLPVPAVPGGVLQEAVCSGGQCYTPLMGTTPTTATGRVDTAARATAQQAASAITNQPNQSVPPRPQPGEVAAAAAAKAAAEAAAVAAAAKAAAEAAAGAGGGKILGLEPMTLAIIVAAGVGALVLLKTGNPRQGK